MSKESLRFISDGYNIILDTETEMYYEAFDKKSSEKLLKILNALEVERLFYKEKAENFKKVLKQVKE